MNNMRYILNTLLIILVSIGIALLSGCQKEPNVDQTVKLKAALQSALDNKLYEHDGIGASVAILLPDGEKWLGTSGLSHDNERIEPEMILDLEV